MKQRWPLQEAKSHFSELVRNAKQQPQFISVRGEPAVVIISQQEYDELTTPSISLVSFLRKSPLVGIKLDLSRDKSPDRDTDL